MSFADALATSLEAVYGFYGVDGTWTPSSGGTGVLLRLLPDEGSAEATLLPGAGKSPIARHVYRVRIAELQAKAPGAEILRNDRLVIGSEELKVINDAASRDQRRAELIIETR